ncbi:MAG: beta-ketoacyl-[acyl-carrier-protein] synthase family protein [Flavobacteriales bacterium]|nr:beta-ketoacyl-[acyl-carrier-protein] synthase family protein [Flavobacteriales bacterium]MBK7942191.1 beta-ketoacyl-[acyl-carrier-protein] synthase family protein [Flavobacteriales bacterium]MBK9701892.1 beta-ketoacyl-[acyl-carrier-protein] synthase family protein [Flavobacteriales bacterium]
MERVVITGMGIWSCLGKDLAEVSESLRIGRSGIVFDPVRKEMGFRSALTGKVDMPDLKAELGRRQRVGMAEECFYAYAATAQAFRQAGIIEQTFLDHEVGILYGNDSSAMAVVEGVDALRRKKDTTLIGSGSIFQSMNSTVTMNLATIFRLRGINFTVSGACASGSHAIGMGYLLIKQGLQRIVLCGGAQEVNPIAFCSFDGISAFSVREQDPTRASRPFDKDRDGLVPSGGSAALVLESLSSALERGAPILAEVMGYGFSSNGLHISDPDLDGQVRALNMALKMAGMGPSDIEYINAHATSTPIGDLVEARAIDTVFGAHRPLVSSTKSMTGHECWMAGASEVVYSVLMMQGAYLAPNINFEEPDEASERLNLVSRPMDKRVDVLLSNSFGFGGTNSSLIIKRYAS